MNPVYEPREDSFLLLKCVRELAKGRVLDMGTGTGILAVAAAEIEEVLEVIGVDINEDAIRFAKERSIHPKAKYFVSDLYQNVDGNFDTIIFNPPYLPNDEEIADIALDGGPTGLELAIRFLAESEDRLNVDGLILMLLSDHTDLHFFEEYARRLGYSIAPIAHEKLDFETIYVYRLMRNG